MIINERRNKIFRILDDALANRPIERDSLILEVRKAFEAFDLLRNSEPLPSAQPEIIYCKDCIHRPIVDDPGVTDGFGLLFPDFKCPCRCDDGYYSWMPNDDWFCGNGEKEAVKDGRAKDDKR